MRQNLAFAFLYNALGVPIAAGVLYPFFGLLLSPLIAALAMSFSSVSVVTNACACDEAQRDKNEYGTKRLIYSKRPPFHKGSL
jgi:Cu+-exporting ATPase